MGLCRLSATSQPGLAGLTRFLVLLFFYVGVVEHSCYDFFNITRAAMGLDGTVVRLRAVATTVGLQSCSVWSLGVRVPGSIKPLVERSPRLGCRQVQNEEHGEKHARVPRKTFSQTFQNPLLKEYTLNYNRVPNMN